MYGVTINIYYLQKRKLFPLHGAVGSLRNGKNFVLLGSKDSLINRKKFAKLTPGNFLFSQNIGKNFLTY